MAVNAGTCRKLRGSTEHVAEDPPGASDVDVPEAGQGEGVAEPLSVGDPAPEERSASEEGDADAAVDDASPRWKLSKFRAGLTVVTLIIFAVVALSGWFAHQLIQARDISATNAMFLQAGRQAAINLTTIDAAHADADVARVLESATGSFLEEFQTNSGPFADTVRKAQAKTVGTVTEAGIESVNGDTAQIAVAVSVRTTTAGVPEDQPRLWRMRITVKKEGDAAKVSNVGFVP